MDVAMLVKIRSTSFMALSACQARQLSRILALELFSASRATLVSCHPAQQQVSRITEYPAEVFKTGSIVEIVGGTGGASGGRSGAKFSR